MLRWILHLLLIANVSVGCATKAPPVAAEIRAERKAVEFLKREVPAWSRENGCFSCHNNGDGARALYTARGKGYRIIEAVLGDTTAWLAHPNRWDSNKGDPGFSDKRLANIQFAAALLSKADATRSSLVEAALEVASDQDANGSWSIDRHNPAGSPATYGTTLATYLATKVLESVDAGGFARPIQKAREWLLNERPISIVSAAALLLDSGKYENSRHDQLLELIRGSQTSDGGWGSYPDSSPEPFDTAIVLLALQTVGHDEQVQKMIQRGRRFLAAQQQPDGGWPATTRPPGGNSYAQRISTTAWATIALLETRILKQ